MEKILKVWKGVKEVGIVIVFIGSAIFSYGKCTANEINVDTNNLQNVTREFALLKDVNDEILKELKTVKEEVQAISKDYKLLKLKLYKANLIEDYGDFVQLDKKDLPHKPKRRIANQLAMALKDNDYDDWLY